MNVDRIITPTAAAIVALPVAIGSALAMDYLSSEGSDKRNAWGYCCHDCGPGIGEVCGYCQVCNSEQDCNSIGLCFYDCDVPVVNCAC